MKYAEIVEQDYPEVYESMHDMDMYHVSEYCQWFVLGLDMGVTALYPNKED